MNSLKNMFRGTGLCARFTFRQAWKTKANLWSFLILALTVVLMPFLYSMGYDSASEKIGKVYYLNNTELENPDFEEISNYDRRFDEIDWQPVSSRDQIPNLESNDLILSFSLADLTPEFTYETADDGVLSDYNIDALIYALKPHLLKKLYVKLGIPASVVEKIGYSDYQGTYDTALYEESYQELHAAGDSLPVNDENTDAETSDEDPDADFSQGPDYETVVNLQMAFSVLMMMISILTASYIIREIIAEKSSKLVDLLMVSMKAQALLLGKILGVLAYVISMMAGIFVIYQGANLVEDKLLHIKAGNDIFASFAGALKGVSVDVVIVFLLAFVFGIMIFALISGLMGAGCSTEEDTSQALGLPMILIMGSYMGSIFLTLFTDGNVLPFISLIPVLSTFILPIQYLLGNINIFIVIASLMIQFAVIIGMIYLCGKLYSSLMVYRGKRLSLSSMIRMVMPARKEEV